MSIGQFIIAGAAAGVSPAQAAIMFALVPESVTTQVFAGFFQPGNEVQVTALALPASATNDWSLVNYV